MTGFNVNCLDCVYCQLHDGIEGLVDDYLMCVIDGHEIEDAEQNIDCCDFQKQYVN